MGICGSPSGRGRSPAPFSRAPCTKLSLISAPEPLSGGPEIPGLLKATKMGKGILSVEAQPLRTYDVDERADGVFVRPRAPP